MNHRIVLVDDMPEIRQVLRLILEHAGPFDVVGEGSNGLEAVSLAADLQPDLVVMDVEMRGGPSGWEVLPRIREASPGTAVVILSGSVTDPMQSDPAAMADGVLEKGLPPQELNDALLAVLGRRGARQAPPTAPAPAPAAERSDVLSALLESTSDAVVQLNPGDHIQAWNRGAERLFGLTATEAIGRPLCSLSADTEAGEHLATLVTRAAGGERIIDSWVRKRPTDAQVGAVTLTLVPIADGVLVVGRPMERAATNDASAGADLEAFASVASHDLAQPLQVAYGYLEMVRSEFAEGMDETAVSWLDAAIGSLERMRLLVQDILAFARSGSRDLPIEEVSVEAAALMALGSIEDLLAERHAEITLQESLPVVQAGELQLTQIFEHLIANAVRFSEAGAAPVVEVSAEEEPAEWIVTVSDNGPGIPPAAVERVFDPFYRDKKAAGSRTGLGLSTCRKLVERMGGRIWVEHHQDGTSGALLRFALPKQTPSRLGDAST